MWTVVGKTASSLNVLDGSTVLTSIFTLDSVSWNLNYFQRHYNSKDGSSFAFRYKGRPLTPLDLAD
jgi:hypothetical protein